MGQSDELDGIDNAGSEAEEHAVEQGLSARQNSWEPTYGVGGILSESHNS